MTKRILFSVFLLAGLSASTKAQTIPKNAIGLRPNAGDGIGLDASYQRKVFTKNRLEFDLGLREDGHYDAVKFAALFHWVFKIDKGFNFYAGPGIGAGHWNDDRNYYNNGNGNDPRWSDNGGYGFVTGVAGIEYVFSNIPLQLSFDIRPEVHFGDDRKDYDNDYHDLVPDVGFGVRYTF
ncbi:hypothetical protein [Flavobacterium silvaticum]|uniref:Outer membrane protein beta-barrel domain-containing protein n=1 Tax=Flavobacterium silvaticum TaxID=1852020 RepID=A0A972FNP0_9FLAO|nr:hypothetical protein [Flavobacterium silvaticum]NMH29027.1 hypothetical protein [Flavobacterium silvaticum]